MSVIFKSLLGALIAFGILICTAGTTLYVCDRIDFAIHDAVALHLSDMRSVDAACSVAPDAVSPGATELAGWEVPSPQPVEGTPVDSRIAALLIEELAEAGPEERQVWAELLRNPSSHESYRAFFSHYRGKAPPQDGAGRAQLESASADQPCRPASCNSCPGSETLDCTGQPLDLHAVLETLRIAERLILERVTNDKLSELRRLHEELIDARQQLQPPPVETAPAPASDAEE